MFLSHIFNFILFANVDPQMQDRLDQVLTIWLPIIYACTSFALVVAGIKWFWKIHSDPENKGSYVRSLVISCSACTGIFFISGIAHIIIAKVVGVI